MTKERRHTVHLFSALFVLLFVSVAIQAGGTEDVLSRLVKITTTKGSRYQLLRQVSDQTGYYFIYDSQVINNDEEVKIRKGEYTVRNAIHLITGNEQIKIGILGNHILLSLPVPEKAPVTPLTSPEKTPYVIKGMAYDRVSKEVISYASVGVSGTSIGTVTNQNGQFQLIVPDSLSHLSVKLSHVGYESSEYKISALNGKHIDFYLEPKVIPLQEVIVRAVNPVQVLNRMIENRKLNYSSRPVYLTTFYREAIEHKNKKLDITESVLKIYKQSYRTTVMTDQVKLIKMRRVFKKEATDTIFTKMKSGINTCLVLDVMRSMPDFLETRGIESNFTYTYTDITEIDGRRVYVISFEQKKEIKEPLYKGQLYIDTDNYALVEIRFEINPLYAEKATNMFLEKRSRDYKLTLRSATYKISYKPSSDHIYYLNHIRGDLEFKVKRNRHFFSSPLHIWFEMVNCRTDTENVNSFPREDRLPTRNVFSETKHEYDADFWEHFNVILPEDELRQLIMNNLSEVSE